VIDPEQIEKIICSILFNLSLGLEIPVIDNGPAPQNLLYLLDNEAGPQVVLVFIVDKRPVGGDNQDVCAARNEPDAVWSVYCRMRCVDDASFCSTASYT
jgi:hypothetical protein